MQFRNKKLEKKSWWSQFLPNTSISVKTFEYTSWKCDYPVKSACESKKKGFEKKTFAKK